MKNRLINLSITLSIFLAGCAKNTEKDPQPINNIEHSATAQISSDYMTVLGEKMINPYTVEAMTSAKNSIQSRGIDFNSNVRKTHLYVRFLPKNTSEYYLMAKHDDLDIYDFPLDYEVTGQGNTYHNPSFPVDEYSWQYCAVKADFQFPAIQYEILAELYLPQQDKGVIDDYSLNLLENTALSLTQGENESRKVASYNPAGTIRVRNTARFINFRNNQVQSIDQMIGLEGAQVRARRWFTTYRAVTDKNGIFRMNDSFSNPCNYSIKWERPDFDILDRSIFGQAALNGPKQSGDWNIDITGGSQLFYATIHRGAWDYYYNDPMRDGFGLKKPPTRNNIFQQRVSLLAKDENNDVPNGDYSGWRAAFAFPHIRIFRSNRNSDEIYSTTIHELAHASHSEQKGLLSFGRVDDVIIESWARCVQYYFTIYRFSTYVDGYDWERRYQDVPVIRTAQLHPYTPMFLDMCDDVNQIFRFGNTRFNDNWDGSIYMLRFIEPALSNINTFQDLEQQLNSTGTEQSASEFYSQYR